VEANQMEEGVKGEEDEKKTTKTFPALQTKYGTALPAMPKKPPPRQLTRTKGEGTNGLRAEALRMHKDLHQKWSPKNSVVEKVTKIHCEELEAQALTLAYDALTNGGNSLPLIAPPREQVDFIRKAISALIADTSSLEIKTETIGERTLSYVDLELLEKLVAHIVEQSKSVTASKDNSSFPFKYSISASTDKGVRATNEDYFLVIEHFNELLGLSCAPQVYVGLYDGHSGKQAAEYCRTHLHVNIGRQEEFQQDISAAMVKAFLRTDERYNETADRMGVNDGTTAMAVLMREDSLIVANCGDARGFLFRGPDAEALSLCPYQHPDREDEKGRVKQAGGTVVWFGTWRVNGVLAVSRSIGDPALRAIVIAEPEIQTSPLSPGDDFFVLATDGLWDVMDAPSVAAFIRGTVASQGPEGIAQVLVNEAINNRNSKDNVTALVRTGRFLK